MITRWNGLKDIGKQLVVCVQERDEELTETRPWIGSRFEITKVTDTRRECLCRFVGLDA